MIWSSNKLPQRANDEKTRQQAETAQRRSVPARPMKLPGSEPPIDSPERRRLPRLLRQAWYGLNQAFRRRIAYLGVTPDQFTVLRTLLENEGMTQRELAQAMTSDANTVASLVERMEIAALLHRRPHEKDRRAHRLYLTASGRRKYSEAREVAVAMQTEILSLLPARERERFLMDLDTVAEACRNAAAQSPKRTRPGARPRVN